MRTYLRYFLGSSLVTIACLIIAVMYNPSNFIYTLYIVILLGILEVSLSFDNAVVNAKVLKKMSPFWRQLFLWLGIFIAVFVVRLVVPIAMVAFAGDHGFMETFSLAAQQPSIFQAHLEASYPIISAFGGGFLLMIFLNFLFSKEERLQWIKKIENSHFVKRNNNPHLPLMIGLILSLIFIVTYSYTIEFSSAMLISLLLGVGLSHGLGSLNQKVSGMGSLAKAGILGFIYLEVLGASFSFDGIFGALVISSDIIIILLGLMIGAMFVRSLTIYMVDKNTLETLPYLEHGAHYSIAYLAISMWVKNFTHIPEYITGTVSIAFIIAALICSIRLNQKEKYDSEAACPQSV